MTSTQILEAKPGSPLLDEVECLFRALYEDMDRLGWRLPLIEGGEKVWRSSIEKVLGRLAVLFVAVEKEQAVGFAHGTIRLAPEFQGGHTIGVVRHLYLVPGARRGGLGRRLVESLMHWFQDKGTHSCELQVIWGNNEGLDFWKHLGFEEDFLQLRKLF